MKPVLALVVTVVEGDLELASDALWGLGVVAVEERRLQGKTGICELWTSLGDDSQAVVRALSGFLGLWPYRFEPVDPAVSETWREFAVPTWVDDDTVIYPAWLAAPTSNALYRIAIEPGVTFGMGDHPTTVLTTRAMRRLIDPQRPVDVLDVGCGSGVLAIAACIFGATTAYGIDIAEAAIPTTLHNAQLNGVSAQVTVSTEDLRDISGAYGLVLANILAPTIIALADDLLRVLSPTGTLIISGILADSHDHVLRALRPLKVTATDELNGWVAVTLERGTKGNNR